MKLRPIMWMPALFAAIAVLGVRFMIARSEYVPQEFFEARRTGAAFAETIVTLSRQSLTRIGQIADFDRQGDFTSALNLISLELVENQRRHFRHSHYI